MTLIKTIFFALLAVAASLSVALAEDAIAPDAGLIVPVELSNPIALGLDPGEWREYRLSGGATDGATLRWTWLETEEHDGQSYQWFETRLTTPGRRLVTKLLANPARLDEIPRIVLMQNNDAPPQSMPSALGQKAVELLNYAGQMPAQSVAEETIEVTAGKYTTQLYTVFANGTIQKIYIATSLPGIVLSETEEFRMELVATGDGGESTIKGAITPFTLPQQRTQPDTTGLSD
jgi:hypothetical protein